MRRSHRLTSPLHVASMVAAPGLTAITTQSTAVKPQLRSGKYELGKSERGYVVANCDRAGLPDQYDLDDARAEQ